MIRVPALKLRKGIARRLAAMTAPYSPAPRAFRPGTWLLAVLASALLLGLAAAPPFVGPGLRAVLMQGFDLVCHQLPERSFQVHGVPFALCHRCTGIVGGLLVGTLVFPLLRRAGNPRVGWLLLLAAAPLSIDWLLGALHLWANTPTSRVLTGFVFGAAAGWVLAQALSATPPVASPSPPRHVALS